MSQSMIDGVQINSSLWLHAAENAVRRECGWHIAPSITETIHLNGTGTPLLHLPTLHLTSLTSLTIDGREALADADWSESGMVELRSGVFPDRFRSIRVTMTHGFEMGEVPDVITLIMTLARRGASQPTVASQSVNGASASYFTAGGAPLSIPLLRSEKDLLAPYRIERRIV